MFAYCLNNPVNSIDTNGEIAISAAILAKLKNAAICGLIAGVVSGVCTLVTGGSLSETFGAFASGFVEGFLGSLFPPLKIGFAAFNALKTGYECFTSGVSWQWSLASAVFALYAGTALGTTHDNVVDAFMELSFGAGLSLMSAGTTEGIKRTQGVNCEASRIAPNLTDLSSNGLIKISLYGCSSNGHGGTMNQFAMRCVT